MSAPDKLTTMQRRIIRLLYEHDGGPAMFPGEKGSRQFGWWKSDMGLVIKAYQTPEYFMEKRGLLVRAQLNFPGVWFRLSDEGIRRAEAMRPEQ